jgi:DNA-binding NarL/FixJ family response regulator
MTTPNGSLRPRDTDALRSEMRGLAMRSETPVLFGGEVHAGTLILSEFVGTRTNGLRGLAVSSSSGLGGRVVDRLRPASVSDYRNASAITHHYDRPVLGEGLRSVLAVPVVVDNRTRAVLYAARRDAAPVGGRTADAVVDACRRLAAEIAVRDEVDRRIEMMTAVATAPPNADPSVTEELRGIHAELRQLGGTLDARAAEQVRGLSNRLARAIGGDVEAQSDVVLAPREVDVLAAISLGGSNIEVAKRLSLRPETVKSYLRSAMRKLDAHTRHEAVVAARRMKLLP